MTAPIDDTTRARIVRLHNSGVPSSHIARRLGVARRDVNRAIRKQAKR
jgi:IS30 family transposase